MVHAKVVHQANISIMIPTSVNALLVSTWLMESVPNVKMDGNTIQSLNVVSGKTHVLPTKF